MAFMDLKKYIRWLCNTGLNRNKTQEKPNPEEKVLALNAVERNNTGIAISSRASATSVASMFTECHISGKMKIK